MMNRIGKFVKEVVDLSMKKICLFGAGNLGKQALMFYGKDNVAFFCDNDEKKQGRLIEGVKVISFNDLVSVNSSVRVVISVINCEAVEQIVRLLESESIEYSFYIDETDISLTNSSIFSEIYNERKWGGEDDFFSGFGSHDLEIIEPYISLLIDFICNNSVSSICDIGCGDFHIMNLVLGALEEKQVKYRYIGVDVVNELIARNKNLFENDWRKFINIDITSDNVILPQADLVIIRQVLQHMDNNSIIRVIKKIRKYKYALITEHIYDGETVKYNLDKPTNMYTRVEKLSGVFLERPPFGCKNIVHLLSLPCKYGIIRTSLLVN